MKIIRRFTPQIHCKFVKSERSFSLCVIHLMWPSCRQTKRKKCSTHSNNNNSFVVSLESGLRSGNESQETNYEDSQWWKQDERKAKTKYKYTFRGRFDVRGFYFLFIFSLGRNRQMLPSLRSRCLFFIIFHFFRVYFFFSFVCCFVSLTPTANGYFIQKHYTIFIILLFLCEAAFSSSSASSFQRLLLPLLLSFVYITSSIRISHSTKFFF